MKINKDLLILNNSQYKMKTKIFFRTYKIELIALIVNIIVFFVSNFFIDLIWASIITIIVLVISTIIIIFIKAKDKDFYFESLDKPGNDKNWVGRGNFKFVRNEKCYEITNSNIGYIFPKISNWDDYSFQFKFKIVNKTIGWIIRAVNLSNYVMLQCDFNGINPHIRIDGEWIIFKKEDTGMVFKKELDLDTWYNARIICEKRNIRVVINQNDRVFFDRHWKIPEGLVATYKNKEKGGQEFNIFKNIDFDFGSIGFRNHGDETAFVKEVLIEKL